MVIKGLIADGALKLLTIWGLTVGPGNDEQADAIQLLDDLALQLESNGLLTGYMAPAEYGNSCYNDDSGLTDWMAGPFKKLLAAEIVTSYGKELSPTLYKIIDEGLRSLQHALINVKPAQNPATLPKGSGNEWAYRDNHFYNEQPDTLDTETDGEIDDLTLENDDNLFINSP